MSVAYFHSKVRLKGDPLWSTLVIILLQGALIYYSGTVVDINNVSKLSSLKFWIGVSVICLSNLGSYPLTQVYQNEQDSLEGDRTLAIFLGAKKTFQFSCICLLLIGYYYHWWEGVSLFPLILFY